MKIKQKSNKIKVNCTNCFKSNHIVFNFAYLTYFENFEKEEKSVLFDRLIELSSVTYLELMQWGKYKGIEEIRTKINKEVPEAFNREIETFDGKYTIIRLYKNNFPTARKNYW